MSFNAKQTSSSIASLASAVLLDSKSSALAKELAGSALSQASSTKPWCPPNRVDTIALNTGVLKVRSSTSYVTRTGSSFPSIRLYPSSNSLRAFATPSP